MSATTSRFASMSPFELQPSVALAEHVAGIVPAERFARVGPWFGHELASGSCRFHFSRF
jgi:hypothetical protein